MHRIVHINGRPIGPGHPIYLVVEAGTTCNGDLPTALQMVDAAVDAGADAIKWMHIDPGEILSDRTVTYEYDTAAGRRVENMYVMFGKLQFTPAQWRVITEHCERRGIEWYMTVDNLPGMEVAEALGCPAYKLSSWDLRFYPLIHRMARTGKPLQVDLGPALLGEIHQLMDEVERHDGQDVILVHCSHAAEAREVNLRSISYLQSRFGLPVGWSADSRDMAADLVAVGLGAALIEKRLTLNRRHEGHHHILALEPGEWRSWARMIRQAEAMLGQEAVRPSLEDLRMKDLYFTSIVAARAMEAGDVVAADDLACRRPGNGISPMYLDRVIGRKATRAIGVNELIRWDDVERGTSGEGDKREARMMYEI